MISCRRPSNKSSRLTLPFGPSNWYVFSTAIHGIRRRSAARASPARMWAFSFTTIFSRAASQSSVDTTGGAFILRCPCLCFLFFSLLVAILFLLRFLNQTETTRSEKFSELADATPPGFLPWIRLRRPLPLWLRCMLGTYALLSELIILPMYFAAHDVV